MDQISGMLRSQHNVKEVDFSYISSHAPASSPGPGLMPPPSGLPAHFQNQHLLAQSQQQIQGGVLTHHAMNQQHTYHSPFGGPSMGSQQRSNQTNSTGLQQLSDMQHPLLQNQHQSLELMQQAGQMHNVIPQPNYDSLASHMPSQHSSLQLSPGQQQALHRNQSQLHGQQSPHNTDQHSPSGHHTAPQAMAPPPAKRGRGRGRPPGSSNHVSNRGTAGHHTSRASMSEHQNMNLLGDPLESSSGPGSVVGDTSMMDDVEEHTLFGAIKSGRVAPQTLVDDWIEQYKTSRDPAMLELMQFFISCCGCKGKITPEMYSRQTHADMIRKMTEEFDEDSGEYPLIAMGKNWKRFKSNFVDFIQLLIRQCQYSIIYDQYMIDQIISLLTGLSDSQVRAFRHTSTLAAMKMMTGLVDVSLNLSINRDNTQRQYEAERQKGQAKRASDRLDVLMNRRQELEENMEEVKNMLTVLFKGIFVHRYRDTQAEIRSICMQEIGVWMRRYPLMFLDDSYLKYVGWTLYDRVGDVRLQCGRALQSLYEDPSLVPSLHLFTSRFKSRLVDMTLDKEPEVAVQAVKVVSCILKFNDSVLEDKDCENIYELVYCTHRPLAQAAGEFLSLKLFQVDPHAPITKTKKGKKRSENTPLIRDLIQFFIESELHEHAAYLVDSLWDSAPMLRDWECMLDLILEEPGRGEELLDANQEDKLIEIMTCCVKQSSTGESPVGRQTSTARHGKQLTQRETRHLQEERSMLSEAFIPVLPNLLMKYSVDGGKLINLLQIPLYLDLEMYTTGRQERPLDLLLKYLQEIVDKHTDSEVLTACSKVYEALCAEELSISMKCQTIRGNLLDALNENFRQAYNAYFSVVHGQPDKDIEYLLVTALKRISSFFPCHDMTPLDMWDSLISICQCGLDRPNYNEEMVALAIGCAYNFLLWQFNRIDEETPDKNELKELRRSMTTFLTLCTSLLNSPSKWVSRESFVSICDLLIVFSRHISEDLSALSALVWEADKDLEMAMARFLQKRVFVDDEVEGDENIKIEDLHERRTHLACFCKLIIYNMLSIRCASVVYKNYLKFYNDFGDIMKTTLGKAREINRVQTAKMIVAALIEGYIELETDQGVPVNRNSEGFQSLKELSRRHNLSFGLDLVKIREAMVALQTTAIQFCCQSDGMNRLPTEAPANLPFLEIIAEFSNKLLRQDKQSLLQYVNKVFPSSLGDSWSSLNVYRASLDPELAETSSFAQSSHVGGPPGSTTGTGNPRGRPKRQNRDSDISVPPSSGQAANQKRRRMNSVVLQDDSSNQYSNDSGSSNPHQHYPGNAISYSHQMMQQSHPSANNPAHIEPKYSSRGRPIKKPNRDNIGDSSHNSLYGQAQQHVSTR